MRVSHLAVGSGHSKVAFAPAGVEARAARVSGVGGSWSRRGAPSRGRRRGRGRRVGVRVAGGAPAYHPRRSPDALDDLVTRPVLWTERAADEHVCAGAVSLACAVAIHAVVAGCSSCAGAAQTATAASADARVGTEAGGGRRERKLG